MIGRTISHYTILEKLGEGGMGTVYKARDIRLDRLVALKFLSQRVYANEDDYTKLLQEARTAAAINHPNICSVLDIGNVEDDEFLVMEFINGSPLRKTISKGAVEFPTARKIILQVAEGLHAAHAAGIIHRDIKPENILVTKEGIAKIADFGLARRTDPASDETDTSAAGTIAYMSPEQVRGEKVNRLTDIWSLGIVLYELVTGQRPFAGEYRQAVQYSIVNQKHRHASELVMHIPSALDAIIDRCLEKIPAKRYQTIEAFIGELRGIDWGSRKSDIDTIKSIAVLPFTDISPDMDNKYFSDGLTEEIITNLSKLKMIRVISRTTLMQYNRTGKTTKQIATDLNVQYILEGSVRKQGSDLRISTQLLDVTDEAYQWSEKYRGTLNDIFDIQETVGAKIVKALKVRLTPGEKKTLKKRYTKNTEAYQLYLKGRFFWNKRNKEALHTAIRYFEEAIEKDPLYALAWSGLSDAYNLISEYGGGSRKELYPKAKAAVEHALRLDNQLAEAHTSLASLLMLDEWNWAEAKIAFSRAIDLNPNYATAHHWHAEWLLFMGMTEEAIREISLASVLDPLSPAILKDKGMTFYYARRYDEAIETATKTFELDNNFARAHRLLSLSYQGKGMFAEAIAENDLWEAAGDNTSETMVWRAQLYAAAGKNSEALRILGELKPETLTSGNSFRALALVYAGLHDNDRAFDLLERAFELRADSLCSLRVDPKIDSLRSDPRFAVLLKKIGLLG